jgi:hypothetical protein
MDSENRGKSTRLLLIPSTILLEETRGFEGSPPRHLRASVSFSRTVRAEEPRKRLVGTRLSRHLVSPKLKGADFRVTKARFPGDPALRTPTFICFSVPSQVLARYSSLNPQRVYDLPTLRPSILIFWKPSSGLALFLSDPCTVQYPRPCCWGSMGGV